MGHSRKSTGLGFRGLSPPSGHALYCLSLRFLIRLHDRWVLLNLELVVINPMKYFVYFIAVLYYAKAPVY